ncbi:hypothetical protein [Streptomyces sp. NPDC058291]
MRGTDLRGTDLRGARRAALVPSPPRTRPGRRGR